MLSLIGYNENILIDETSPEWPFLEGYYDYIPKWKASHNPMMWMKNSCVWYSQVLTSKLSQETIQQYLDKFSYGNQDFSGDAEKNNSLTRAWLGSSLKISSMEQMQFLKKFLSHSLPVSNHAWQMTKNILFLNDEENGWKLYGKTGSGYDVAWLVGWAEKAEKSYVFVINYQGSELPSHQERLDTVKKMLKEADVFP